MGRPPPTLPPCCAPCPRTGEGMRNMACWRCPLVSLLVGQLPNHPPGALSVLPSDPSMQAPVLCLPWFCSDYALPKVAAGATA